MNVPRTKIPIYILLCYYPPNKARMIGHLHGILLENYKTVNSRQTQKVKPEFRFLSFQIVYDSIKKLENFNNQPGRRKKKMLFLFNMTDQLFIIDEKKGEINRVLFCKFSNCIISATKRPINLFQKPRQVTRF